MYPLVIRGVHALGLSYPAAAEWSSFVIGAVASVAVWMLAVDVLGDERASRAVLLFVFFPAAFVLSMVYAEGMLLVGGAGCLLLLGRRQWLGAGIAGAVATASRPNGVVVVVCCAWASIVAIRERREWRSLVAPAVAPLGAVGFFAYLWARTGNSTAWFFVERQGWHEHIDGGRASARLALRFVTDPFHDSTSVSRS